MNEPRRPKIREAFNDSADAAAAWRQQQIAALTAMQRQVYEQACRKSKEREEAKAKELERRKQADIQERMRKKILESPRLELVLGAGRTKISEVLAKRLAAEYFQPGSTPSLTQFEMLVRDKAEQAAREIEQEHARERKEFGERERAGLDTTLRRFERARESKGQSRQDFARAGVKDKAKTEFQKAAKDDAIARAIAKVKAKEEVERQRGERDQGRDRGR